MFSIGWPSCSLPAYPETEVTTKTVEVRSSGHIHTLTLNLRSKREPQQLADLPSTEARARAALTANGYDIGEEPLIRKLDNESGEGFWDITINFLRMVSYERGEYVQPHYHDIHETFTVRDGGCFVWISEDAGKTWDYNYCRKGELVFPGKSWHCLVAGPDGLCMDVTHDSKRSINWLDGTNASVWRKDLKYVVTTQELREATQIALKDV
jgi:hypothetical protein